MKNFRIKIILTAETGPAERALNSSKLSKSQAIIAASMSYIYKFLFVLVLLFLNDHHWAQLTVLNMITIGSIKFFLYLSPFEDAS
jgi:hypothetical protein